MSSLFFKKTDNSPLIVFRVLFGLLMVAECWGAIGTGWVKETFVEPSFTFTFIGFEWTRFLLGKTMYVYFFLMGLFAWGVALGYRYRLSIILLASFWTLVYLMQKTHYNNHYYLISIIAFILCFLPANRYFSLDVTHKRVEQELACPRWCLWIFAAEITIVYTFSALAKIYPGWIHGDFIAIAYGSQAHWFDTHLGWHGFADILRNKSVQHVVLWSAIFFDLLIAPALMWSKTRTPAFILTFVFHLANSIILHIGIFPYFALSFALFFYPPQTIRRIFFKNKKMFIPREVPLVYKQSVVIGVFVLLAVHTFLPLRHYLIKDDVFWTEEGHRLSWRMMLRSKSGHTSFVLQLPDGKTKLLNPSDYLMPEQVQVMQTKPDMIWQFVRYVKKKYHEKGIDGIKIFADGKLSLNGGKYYKFINDTVDLTKEKWHVFAHEKWLLPSPKDFNSWFDR